MQAALLARRDGAVSRRLRVALGTLVAIEAEAQSSPAAQSAVEAAFDAVADLGRLLHPHSPGSDLHRINCAPPGCAVAVHAATSELLRLALRLHALTEGAFDPCLPARPGALGDVELGELGVICHAPVSLDFGGFAKGYAVDRAIESLMLAGCSAGLVNAGGDLRVFGSRTEPLLLRGPGNQIRPVALRDAALAVSDADSAQKPPEHQGYYLRGTARMTGSAGNSAPSRLLRRFAAVIAKEAVVADALAKCVMLCSPVVAGRALAEYDARLADASS